MMCTKYAEYAWVNVMTKLHIYALSISSCWCLGSERPTRSPGSGTARVTHDSLSPGRHRDLLPVTGTRWTHRDLLPVASHWLGDYLLAVWPPAVTARAAVGGPDWPDQQIMMNGRELHPSLILIARPVTRTQPWRATWSERLSIMSLSSTVARPSRSDGPTVELLLWLSPGPPAGRACHGGTVPVGCQQSWLERRYIGA